MFQNMDLPISASKLTKIAATALWVIPSRSSPTRETQPEMVPSPDVCATGMAPDGHVQKAPTVICIVS